MHIRKRYISDEDSLAFMLDMVEQASKTVREELMTFLFLQVHGSLDLPKQVDCLIKLGLTREQIGQFLTGTLGFVYVFNKFVLMDKEEAESKGWMLNSVTNFYTTYKGPDPEDLLNRPGEPLAEEFSDE